MSAVLTFLEAEAAKGKRGWLDRLPDKGGEGTHPDLYALYCEYIESGKYPYLDDVQRFITDRLPEVPPFNGAFSGHVQPDPIQRQLQSEMYVASQQYRAEQAAARAEQYIADGFTPLREATLEPDGRYMVLRDGREPVECRPVFRDGELWGFLPPRKRTHGWPLYSLTEAVFVKVADRG